MVEAMVSYSKYPEMTAKKLRETSLRYLSRAQQEAQRAQDERQRETLPSPNPTVRPQNPEAFEQYGVDALF